MAIKGMHLIWVTVADLAAAELFYSQSLGLTIHVSDKEHGWLEFSGSQGGFRLGVMQVQQDSCCGGGDVASRPEDCKNEGPGSNAVVTMDVDDIVQSKKELEAKGVRFTSPIMELTGQVKLASFVDPDGNQFQLVELLNGK